MEMDRFLIFKNKKVLYICIAAAVVAVAIIAFGISLWGKYSLPASFSGLIEITPAYASEYGMDRDQGFIITSKEPLTDELVKTALAASPEFEYTLKSKDAGKTYEVIPKEPLDPGMVYKLEFDPERTLAGQPGRAANTWAFQTESSFQMLGSIPKDQGTDVPVNSVLQLTFTQEVSASVAKKSIRIEPEITGEWQTKGAQLTFVPGQNMAEETVYTITLASDLMNAEKKATLGKEIEIKFQTKAAGSEENKMWYQIDNDNNCFRPDERPGFRFFAGYDNTKIESFDVEVYAFANMNDYAAALNSRQPEYYWSYNNAVIKTDKLSKLSSFTLKPVGNGNLVHFPEQLTSGYYLADFTANGVRRQSLFQVTNMSSYTATNGKDSLIWLNDLKTGLPISGAKVTVYGSDHTATSDTAGVAVAPTPADQAYTLFTITHGADSLVMKGQNYTYYYYYNEKDKRINAYDYWYYLYADRPLYKPGDTVSYFGIMAPRDRNGKQITEAVMVLEGGAYWAESAIRQKITIEDGVISGEFKLPILNSGWYSLHLDIDGQSFGYAGFEVKHYEKPAYKFSLSHDKSIAMSGDRVTWTISANYFEGTPVAGLESGVSANGFSGKKVTTDQTGKTAVSYTMPQDSIYGLMSSFSVSADAVLPELGSVYQSDTIRVFNSDVDIDADIERTGDAFDLRVRGYDVDISNLDGELYPDAQDYRVTLKGAHDLQIKLIRIEYDVTTQGPFYNEYTLQTYYTNHYERREVQEDSFGLKLSAGELDYTGALQYENAYQLVISGKDHSGRNFERTYYIPGKTPYSGDEDYYRYFYLSEIQHPDQYEYAVGDGLKFVLKDSEEQVSKPAGGNILYFRSQETIRDYQLSGDGSYEMVFSEEDVPNVNLTAVCFDGQYYVECSPRYIELDPADKAAVVNIKTDKKRYAPGETVNMVIDMTDKNGKPLSGTVNINLVDEALLAIDEQYVNFGASIFGNTYGYNYSGTASHLPVDRNAGGAEMGDGGGDDRDEFRDTAFFTTISTDKKGHAELSFALPDNITSWRIIWHGYSPSIYAGSGSLNIDASLDFFLDYRFAKTYIIGDMPKMGVRSAGRGIDPLKSKTAYTMEVPSVKKSETVSGTANLWTEIALSALSAGEYELKISASNGKYKDAVSTKFTVIDSFASYDAADTVQLKKGVRPSGSDLYPTTLVFSDEAYSKALDGLYRLAGTGGVRLEQNLAAHIAQNMLAERFDVEYFKSDEEKKRIDAQRIAQYQMGNGGIAAFTYGEAEMETGVLAASVGKEYFDQYALARYFYDALEQIKEENVNEKTLPLWGLAALGEPVLLELKAALDDPALTEESRLYLTMALYYAGDGAEAKKLSEGMLKDWVSRLGGDPKMTARLALLANVFDLPQGDPLARYVEENPYDADPFLLEKLGISQSRLARLPEKPARFTYTLDGETHDINLREQFCYHLMVLPEQLDKISFGEISGDVTLTSLYRKQGQPPDGAGAAQGKLSFARSYNGQSGNDIRVPQNGIVKVTIQFTIAKDAPNGCYNITDFLPAGLRFGKMTNEWRDGVYLLDEDDKKLTFGVYKGSSSGNINKSISYVAYPAMTGSFTAEAPYFAYTLDDQILIHAPETKITIE